MKIGTNENKWIHGNLYQWKYENKWIHGNWYKRKCENKWKHTIIYLFDNSTCYLDTVTKRFLYVTVSRDSAVGGQLSLSTSFLIIIIVLVFKTMSQFFT